MLIKEGFKATIWILSIFLSYLKAQLSHIKHEEKVEFSPVVTMRIKEFDVCSLMLK